jgi:hypothetical protein
MVIDCTACSTANRPRTPSHVYGCYGSTAAAGGGGWSACEANSHVERSLYQRAIGYSHDAVKIFQTRDGKIVEHKYVERYPPDPASMCFWLKNRRPDRWRDVQRIDAAMGHYVLSDRSVAALLAAGAIGGVLVHDCDYYGNCYGHRYHHHLGARPLAENEPANRFWRGARPSARHRERRWRPHRAGRATPTQRPPRATSR